MFNHVGFTGTKEGMTTQQMFSFTTLAMVQIALGYKILHEGDCVGADAQANKMWRDLGGMIHQHPPIVTKYRAYSVFTWDEKPKDYIERNHDIVDASDIVLATPRTMREEQRSGTWSAIRYARKKSKVIAIIWPDGTVTVE